MEDEEANLGAGGSAPATNAGGEGATSSQPGVGKSYVPRPCSFLFFLILDLSSASFPFLVARPRPGPEGGHGGRPPWDPETEGPPTLLAQSSVGTSFSLIQ